MSGTRFMLVLAVFVLAALAVDVAILRLELPNGIRGLFSATIASAGSIYALTAFEKGDPPRTAWLLLTISFVSMIAVVMLAFSEHAVRLGIDHWALVGANILYGVSILVFVRVMTVSGLTPGWTWGSAAAMGACIVFAGGTAAFSLASDFMGPLPTHPEGVALLAAKTASVVCDAVVFVGAANLVRLLLPMRGGSVARSYLLLAFGAGTFLVMDFTQNFIPPASLTQMTTLGEIVAAAWALLALAGFTQGHLARD